VVKERARTNAFGDFMTNKTTASFINASELTPDHIIALSGESYNECARNFEEAFPGIGKEFVRLLYSNRDRLYSSFKIPKRNSKDLRTISAPNHLLKAIQRGAEKMVSNQFVNHRISHGFVKGRSPRTAAEVVRRIPQLISKCSTNIDIKGAFPSIEGRKIRSLLRNDSTLAFSPWKVKFFSHIFTRADDRLSTGSPASPTIFNWALTTFDKEMEEAATKRGWQVIRYADDVTVVHEIGQKQEAIELTARLLKQRGLRIERRKLKSYKSGYCFILGLIVTPFTVRSRRTTRRTMRGLAHGYERILGKAKNLYSHRDAGEIRQLLPERWEAIRGSLTSKLSGHCAYIIGIDRPMRNNSV
jgi:hypothetical protein